jgi:hypothetical protein
VPWSSGPSQPSPDSVLPLAHHAEIPKVTGNVVVRREGSFDVAIHRRPSSHHHLGCADESLIIRLVAGDFAMVAGDRALVTCGFAMVAGDLALVTGDLALVAGDRALVTCGFAMVAGDLALVTGGFALVAGDLASRGVTSCSCGRSMGTSL